MRKFWGLLVVLMLVFSLAACGGQDQAPEEAAPVEEAAPAEEAAPEPEQEEETDETEEEDPSE
jgi:predicted small lipoprotein YifL